MLTFSTHDKPNFHAAADEFVAHNGTVNCLRIGRNTAGVLATGGEDKKVNLWRIGQPHVAKVGLLKHNNVTPGCRSRGTALKLGCSVSDCLSSINMRCSLLAA